jgi:hypothetical protein
VTAKRPSFKKAKTLPAYDSPEELFGKLSNRAKTHGYLRAPQGDALREYVTHKTLADIAFELPTGTGKTLVGLLVAEWRRRTAKGRVAYLTLTNQLAKQVLSEAQKLGFDCADLTGTKDTRRVSEVGRYQSGKAVAVTTYSNLFNVNPIIQASSLLVFDDAHGGEHFVTDMWTAVIRRDLDKELYDEVLTILRPAITESQFQIITDESQFGAVELVDLRQSPDIITTLTKMSGRAEEAWKRLLSVDETSQLPPCMPCLWFSKRNRDSACDTANAYTQTVQRHSAADIYVRHLRWRG